MIITGNGPPLFVALGPPGQSTGPGAQGRTETPGSGAPEASIPAAAPRRTGQPAPQAATRASDIRSVLAVSRTERPVADPQDLYRGSGESAPGRAGPGAHLDYRAPPVPPLTAYASVPMEVTAEIQRLRAENQELKAALAEASRKESGADDGELVTERSTPTETGPSARGAASTDFDRAFRLEADDATNDRALREAGPERTSLPASATERERAHGTPDG